MMRTRLAVSLVAASLLASGAAYAQSTTVEGAANGAAAGGAVAGPVGAMVGGTVGAAVGAAVEIPNAVITSIDAGTSCGASGIRVATISTEGMTTGGCWGCACATSREGTVKPSAATAR